MAVYDDCQMKRMRQEAIRRSQEMHSRAAHYTQGGDRADKPIQPEIPPQPQSSGGLLSEITGSLDGDRLLIGALLLLMLKEGRDMRLILALGYILL